jgi:Initiator Replication protein
MKSKPNHPDGTTHPPKGGRIIRQPYRLTMAWWDCNVHEKRILTAIIASLQKELAWVEKGMRLEDLPLERDSEGRFILNVPLRLTNPSANNYFMVHRTLDCLEKKGIELRLPAVKGRRGPKLPEECILFNLTRLRPPDNRTLRISIDDKLMAELLRSTSGLTSLSLEVMSRLSSVYAIRIYEILSHWKDQPSQKFSIEQLRGLLDSQKVLPQSKEFLRYVIEPARQQLKQSADLYFQIEKIYSGNRITHLNLRIIQHKSEKEQELINLRLREQVTNILRIRFGWKPEHFQKISQMLEDPNRLRELNDHIGRLWHFLDQHPEQVQNYTNWSFSAILKNGVENC